MKYIFFVIISFFFLCESLIANEIGFTISPIVQYSGSAQIYEDNDTVKFEKSGTPFSLYSIYGYFKLDYLRYEQYADDTQDVDEGSVVSMNDAIVLSGYYNFLNLMGNLNFFASLGIGSFQSRVFLERSFYWITQEFHYTETANSGGLGTVISLGAKWIDDHSVLGFEIRKVEAQAFHDFNGSSAAIVSKIGDIGGIFFSIVAGVKF